MKVTFHTYSAHDDGPEGMAAKLTPETEAEETLLSPLFKYGKLLIDERESEKVSYLIHWSLKDFNGPFLLSSK